MTSASLPFSVAFVRDHAFGAMAGVHLPPGKDPVAGDVLARLHDDEARVARTLGGYRQVEWTGARLAWRSAASRFGVADQALLSGAAREPLAPAGFSVSITHKRDLAIALVAREEEGTVGIDLEGHPQRPMGIAPRVLRAEELADVNALPESERADAVTIRFALKEAAYKAVYPHVRRYVGYDEARVVVTAEGAVSVTMLFAQGEPAPRLEAMCERHDARFIAAVRCRVDRTPPREVASRAPISGSHRA